MIVVLFVLVIFIGIPFAVNWWTYKEAMSLIDHPRVFWIYPLHMLIMIIVISLGTYVGGLLL